MWFSIWRMSVLWVMKAMRRIGPPQIGHTRGNTSQIQAISTAHR
jgi:hypothetical protein